MIRVLSIPFGEYTKVTYMKHKLKDSKDQIIYIPTEAGVPITESFRLKENK